MLMLIGLGILLYKKKDKKDPKNYRVIVLLSCILKLYEVILSKRFIAIILYQLCPSQFGFKRLHGVQDTLWIFNELIEYATSRGVALTSVQIDAYKS